MATKRSQAVGILNAEVPEGRIYRSNEGGPPYLNRFNQLTNTNHTLLLANWLGVNGIMTACNGFVGWYAGRLGIAGITNWFKLFQALAGGPHSDAWVPASTKGARPKPGDILRHSNAFHVDVAIGLKGNILRRVGAGQGDGTMYSLHDPKRDPKIRALEYDCLRRVDGSGPYNWQNLEGWLDIDLFFRETDATADAVPDWLVGWWRVTWRGMTYFYYFDQNHEAKWTEIQPPLTTFPPLAANDTGDFTADQFSVIAVRWRTTQAVETLRPKYASSGNEMTGMCDGDRMTAVKL